MLTWLKHLFTLKAKTSPAKAETPQHIEQLKRKDKSHIRTHNKRVLERERDLRRNYTGQKGE
ncbi:uncharacterized protein N7529_004877 [Penicillium soppii]|jgi:hypothetical protein|uniref:uncharacterized protein n=1 Tax=Penicillium soppii TaxID=69789 RepID=UPI0025482F2D|nr:uncharacterized protein N7529_004877 [Penicillium soppii]KAJ5872524.1 hypothetical protein N7529_004877 [Penicillium soppii]